MQGYVDEAAEMEDWDNTRRRPPQVGSTARMPGERDQVDTGP
jgi:hypothetical protein